MRIAQLVGEDGAAVVMLSFFYLLPESTEELSGMEAAKMITTKAHAKKVVEAMCKNLNHYPEKPAD